MLVYRLQRRCRHSRLHTAILDETRILAALAELDFRFRFGREHVNMRRSLIVGPRPPTGHRLGVR